MRACGRHVSIDSKPIDIGPAISPRRSTAILAAVGLLVCLSSVVCLAAIDTGPAVEPEPPESQCEPGERPRRHRITIERFVDGDTVDVVADLGFGTLRRLRVRVSGIQAPEIYSAKKGSDERARGESSRRFAETWAGGHDALYLEAEERKDKYGRILGNIFPSKTSPIGLSGAMIDGGFAEAYKK